MFVASLALVAAIAAAMAQENGIRGHELVIRHGDDMVACEAVTVTVTDCGPAEITRTEPIEPIEPTTPAKPTEPTEPETFVSVIISTPTSTDETPTGGIETSIAVEITPSTSSKNVPTTSAVESVGSSTSREETPTATPAMPTAPPSDAGSTISAKYTILGVIIAMSIIVAV